MAPLPVLSEGAWENGEYATTGLGPLVHMTGVRWTQLFIPFNRHDWELGRRGLRIARRSFRRRVLQKIRLVHLQGF